MTFSQKLKSKHKIHIDPQKTQKSQSNPKAREQSWSYHNTLLQNILQSYINQNSMLLV
jgi:hypothetical protein